MCKICSAHVPLLFEVIQIIFEAIQNHDGDQRANTPNTFFGVNILSKFSYRADNIKINVYCPIYCASLEIK